MLANRTFGVSLPQKQSSRKAQAKENNASSKSDKKRIWVDRVSNTS
jgi:hypothetical protein